MVLPLVGGRVRYPAHALRGRYRALLLQDGLAPTAFGLGEGEGEGEGEGGGKGGGEGGGQGQGQGQGLGLGLGLPRECRPKGAYRRLLCAPTGMRWDWVQRPAAAGATGAAGGPPVAGAGEAAVLFEFALPRGSYATVCLAEVLGQRAVV